MLKASEIKQLHTQQGKKLEAMRDIVDGIAKRHTSKTSGRVTQEDQLRASNLNAADLKRAEQVLHNMRSISQQLLTLEPKRTYLPHPWAHKKPAQVPAVT